jgi:transcriptional regulator with XRE-family HTH domain
MSTPSTAVGSDHFSLALGGAIRARRKALGLSLVEVSARTGLSHSFLSQLERGKTRASMRSLFSISQALETTQEELIARASGSIDDSAVQPHAPRPPASTSFETSAKARVQVLMHSGDQLDITEFANLPRELGDYFVHERPEFIYVVSGEIEFEMRAEGASAGTSLRLVAGQTVSCPGSMNHRYRSVGDALATVLMIHYPA